MSLVGRDRAFDPEAQFGFRRVAGERAGECRLADLGFQVDASGLHLGEAGGVGQDADAGARDAFYARSCVRVHGGVSACRARIATTIAVCFDMSAP